ncbi:hypothetical protein CBL_12061 [Carabus blaptoides fortunei]
MYSGVVVRHSPAHLCFMRHDLPRSVISEPLNILQLMEGSGAHPYCSSSILTHHNWRDASYNAHPPFCRSDMHTEITGKQEHKYIVKQNGYKSECVYSVIIDYPEQRIACGM